MVRLVRSLRATEVDRWLVASYASVVGGSLLLSVVVIILAGWVLGTLGNAYGDWLIHHI